MVEVRWLNEAKQDLRYIYEYISHDSKKYAQRQVSRIFQRTKILKNHIRAGKIVGEFNRPEIREIVENHYRIIYRIIDEETVDILMVHHGARDFTRRFKN